MIVTVFEHLSPKSQNLLCVKTFLKKLIKNLTLKEKVPSPPPKKKPYHFPINFHSFFNYNFIMKERNPFIYEKYHNTCFIKLTNQSKARRDWWMPDWKWCFQCIIVSKSDAPFLSKVQSSSNSQHKASISKGCQTMI